MDKSRIIEMIRKNKPVMQPFPESFKASKPETDLAIKFGEVLKQVGAEIFYIENEKKVPEFISSHYNGAVDFSNPDLWKAALDSIPDIEQLDKVILQAQFGVAENGAVWLDESNFPKRIIPFIGKHLIIKLVRKNLIGGII